MIERTFVMLKPDAVQRQISGQILTRFENAGFKIVGLKMKWVDADHSKKHYAEHAEKPFFKGLDTFLRTGPVVAFVLEGVNAIEGVRKMVGSTEPKGAAPGTIRGDYAHVSYGYADSKGIGVKNLIHASANEADAKREIALWFEPEDLHSYKSVHDVHILE